MSIRIRFAPASKPAPVKKSAPVTLPKITPNPPKYPGVVRPGGKK